MKKTNEKGRVIDVSTFEELGQLADELIRQSAKGARIGLIGDLGAGKTTFTQQVASRLETSIKIISPTFTIRQSYQILVPSQYREFIHYDLYRINSTQDLLEVGLVEDLKNKQNFIMIEWADRMGELKNKLTDQLSFAWDPTTDRREVRWECQSINGIRPLS